MQNSIAIPKSSGTDPAGWLARPSEALAFGGLLALVLFRLVLAVFDRTELSTDEAQYWFWGQTLEFGAYSKPPLISWILRLATDVMGQTVWAVRLPAVLFHAATAAVIYLIVRKLAPAPTAALAAACYLTTPAVALGSALMTTDTPMLTAAAVALFAQMRLAEAHGSQRKAPLMAIVLGLALGLGLLAKHAMLFWLLGAVAAAVLSPAWRIARADALLSAVVFAAVISPHLIWLVQQDFVTFSHIQDITEGERLSLLRPLRFLAEQLIVMGPVLLAAMILALCRSQDIRWAAGLAILALTPLLIIAFQAVRGDVLANWAVLYLVPGSILAAMWLARYPRLAGLSLAIGLVVSLALPSVKVFGTSFPGPGGQPLLKRYLGHSEVANWALATARLEGAGTLVANDRDLLADLSWFGHKHGLAIRALPPDGRPLHHWQMKAPLDPSVDPGPVLLLLREPPSKRCHDAREVGRLAPGPGFAGNETLVIYLVTRPACLASSGATQ